MTIGDRVADKSDLEHGATGGVITDTPFDAPEDYEDDKRHQLDNEFQHEKEKKPKNLKEDSHEIKIGYVTTGKAEELEKEGGAVTTGTSGVNNAVYNERKLRNKYNTRNGPRQASQEEIDRFLNK